MNKLSYQTLKDNQYDGFLLEEAPERIIQFGEGNFMRAFVDCFIDEMNEKSDFNSKVLLIQPIANTTFRLNDILNEQDDLYTLYLQGMENGKRVRRKRVISAVSRCLNSVEDWEEVMKSAENPSIRFIASNTTEAGIVYDPTCRLDDQPPASFPAKLTKYLYHRYQSGLPGFIILSCELIDDNGKELEKIVLRYADDWNLPEDFRNWIKNENIFCSTLVDRIVTGFPKKEAESLNQENHYEDNAMDAGEIFGFWVIEGPQSIRDEFPFEQAGLPIVLTDNHKPYKERKVRILNGAHTSMVLGAFLAGEDIVRDCMYDPDIEKFFRQTVYDEIIPTLSLPEKECVEFADAVSMRFKNPFIDHALLSISLNSTSKWKTRVLPSLKGYVNKFSKIPKALAASLAFYISFYRGNDLKEDGLIGSRGSETYKITDDRYVLEFFYENRTLGTDDLCRLVLENEILWGENLTQIEGFLQIVQEDLHLIDEKGARALMKKVVD